MNLVIAKNNQTIYDLCIQEYGNLKPLFEFAQANDIATTDDLEIGKQYVVPVSKLSDIEIVNFYKKNSINPATALPVQDYSAAGIGEMIIESTFKIG